MSLFSATTWIGGIIGFTATGYAVQNLGTTSTFIVGVLLSLIAIILLIPIRPPSLILPHKGGGNF